jgi:hypothetical protein
VWGDVTQPALGRPILRLSTPDPVAQIGVPHNGHYVKLAMFPLVRSLLLPPIIYGQAKFSPGVAVFGLDIG